MDVVPLPFKGGRDVETVINPLPLTHLIKTDAVEHTADVDRPRRDTEDVFDLEPLQGIQDADLW